MAPSEKEKMLAGELYRADDRSSLLNGAAANPSLRAYNDEVDEEARSALLHELLGRAGDGAMVQPPFTCDYGYNISLGTGTFVNLGGVILDVAPVAIGDHVQIGTAVQILAADHPTSSSGSSRSRSGIRASGRAASARSWPARGGAGSGSQSTGSGAGRGGWA